MVARALSRGAFIAFEGVDRSGKSTQSAKLVDALTASGVTAELWRFPDRESKTGKQIDAYLKGLEDLDDLEVHELFAENRKEKKHQLEQKLKGGTTLIVDRYVFSGAVFTAAKGLPHLDLEKSKEADKVRELPAPDAVIYLDLSVEAAAKRGGFGQERYEKQGMQLQVRKLYSTIQKIVPGWITLDAGQSEEDLSAQIIAIAKCIVEECRIGSRPALGRVWADEEENVPPPTTLAKENSA